MRGLAHLYFPFGLWKFSWWMILIVMVGKHWRQAYNIRAFKQVWRRLDWSSDSILKQQWKQPLWVSETYINSMVRLFHALKSVVTVLLSNKKLRKENPTVNWFLFSYVWHGYPNSRQNTKLNPSWYNGYPCK